VPGKHLKRKGVMCCSSIRSQYPEGTVFVFYCDTGKETGKETKERLPEFRRRFPDKICISLRGGRGYWRKSLRI